jgi:hypothetical protein
MKTYKLTVYVQLQEEDIAESAPIYRQETGMAGYTPGYADVAEYAQAALASWGGQLHPYDPFFPTNVKVEIKDCVELQNNRTMPERSE